MLISHKKKFIFIHIYKNAGTSITEIFMPYARFRDRMVYDFWITRKVFGRMISIMKWQDDGGKQFTGIHQHASAYEIRSTIGGTIFNSYYKFAFVRNPYNFLVSLYFYIKAHPEHRIHEMAVRNDFSDFIKRYIDTNPKRQVDFLIDPETGHCLLDYIGRVETLRSDVASICRAIGLRDLSADLTHRNPSALRKHNDYQNYYTDSLCSLVDTYFNLDMKRLGYTFEGMEDFRPMDCDI